MTINHNRAEVYKAKEKGVERGRPKKKKKKVLQGNKKTCQISTKRWAQDQIPEKGLEIEI